MSQEKMFDTEREGPQGSVNRLGLKLHIGIPRLVSPRYRWRCPVCGEKTWCPADGLKPTGVEVKKILDRPECGRCQASPSDSRR